MVTWGPNIKPKSVCEKMAYSKRTNIYEKRGYQKFLLLNCMHVPNKKKIYSPKNVSTFLPTIEIYFQFTIQCN